MKQKALTTPVNAGSPDGSIVDSFNAEAKKSCEIEIKFIVPGNADSTVDHNAFPMIKDFFSAKGWIKIEKENTAILSRQMDTPGRTLLLAGSTLRSRGNCEDGNIRSVKIADICLKMGKTMDKSGAIRRGEYQTGIKDFNRIDLKALRDAYPQDKFPEVHAALEGVKPSDLREFFRIDCIRHRYVLEIPSSVSGLAPDRKLSAELLLDDNAFVLDVPGLKYPLVFHHDLEVECEALFRPCEFDRSPDAAKYVSSDLTLEETDQAMTAIRHQIQAAAGGTLMINTISKAERGFTQLDEALTRLHDYVLASHRLPKKDKVQSAFRISAEGAAANDNEKLHYFLLRDFGPILRERSIAKYAPK